MRSVVIFYAIVSFFFLREGDYGVGVEWLDGCFWVLGWLRIDYYPLGGMLIWVG